MTDGAARSRSSGRIATFYSYKGGMGRTMAVANVGWILASAGFRVLLIDWDLEAPGLHRYLVPFLEDPELVRTPGVIDFLVDFAAEARVANTADDWYESSASLLRYTQAVQWPFANDGALELVGAGRQNAGYAIQVTRFDWHDFHEQLGGGLFLQAVKQRLRQDYDFVLVDSRTGISDSSGVCTVQMPDMLFVLFTLNAQSILGAAAVAASADGQRRKSKDEPGLRIWPVQARVELAEKDRLEAGRSIARLAFDRFIRHLPRSTRSAYWDEMEIIYQPYYAYEETLAAFADHHRSSTSMLKSMETIATRLAGRPVALSGMTGEKRKLGMDAYRNLGRGFDSPESASHVFISYPEDCRTDASALRDALTAAGVRTWWDGDVLPGDDRLAIRRIALHDAGFLVVLQGRQTLQPVQASDIEAMLALGKRVVPVLVGGANSSTLPEPMQNLAAMVIRPQEESSDRADVSRALLRVLERDRKIFSNAIDPADPQRGRFGGLAQRGGRAVTASVKEVTPDWFEITLIVRTLEDGALLRGIVEFHLHPAHTPHVHQVEASKGVARLTIFGYGAFTVGVVADDGRTMLELNLAADDQFPPVFRDR